MVIRGIPAPLPFQAQQPSAGTTAVANFFNLGSPAQFQANQDATILGLASGRLTIQAGAPGVSVTTVGAANTIFGINIFVLVAVGAVLGVGLLYLRRG